MKKHVLIAVVIVLTALIGESVFLVMRKTTPEPIACTMEAKLCPDGSAVGRTGPSCEFALCPSTTTSSSSQVVTQNGVSITPLAVEEDSRCPIEVQCIWAGQVRLRAVVDSGPVKRELTLVLGTSAAFEDTTVTLIGVTPTPHTGTSLALGDYHFTFSVDRVIGQGHGRLEGHMTLGPVCPVERVDNPCKPTPEMYAARKIFIYTADRKTLVTTITPDGEGNFATTLAVGSYYTQLAESGLGSASGIPRTITITKDKMTWLDIDVDTGIR